jgi:uncharacterized membrane protein YeaQ/YmgE (transglycosylase-associated protein family)
MDIVQLIVSLVSGAVGGNIAGAVMKDKSLGTAGNSIAGILGGGIGGAILQMLGLLPAPEAGATGIDLTAILGNVGSGGVGGAILLVIVSLVRNAMKASGQK